MKPFLNAQSFTNLFSKQRNERSGTCGIQHPNAKKIKKMDQLTKNEGDSNLPEIEPLEVDSEIPRRLTGLPNSTLEESKDNLVNSACDNQKQQKAIPQIRFRFSNPLPTKISRRLENPYILTKHTPEEEARLDEIRKKILREDRRMEEILNSRRIPLSQKSMSQLSRFINNGKIEEKYKKEYKIF